MKFHQTKAWKKLAKEHKAHTCYWCGKPGDQSDHVLPVSRFPMLGLWKINLVIACESCNQSKGNRLKLSFKTIKLLGIYAMIKFFMYLITFLIIAALARYAYLDITFNNATITDQIESDIIDTYRAINGAV